MKWLWLPMGVLALAITSPLQAQRVPEAVDEVAHPGGVLPGDPEIALVKVADAFFDPLGVANAGDGSGRIFVVERVGRVKIAHPDGTVQDEPFLDLTQVNPIGNIVQHQFVEQGLYSIAFHPNFAENGHVYVHYASLPFNGGGVVNRYTVDPASPDVVTAERANETSKVILRIGPPYYNHNGGRIVFGPNDGYLYIASGDGGWEGDVLEVGQNLGTWLGKILRVDDAEANHYRVPPNHPFVDAQRERDMVLFGIPEEEFATIKRHAKTEIWTYGLRNPYQMHFNKENGDLFIADVGQNHWEMIYWQPGDSPGGENYGWPLKNGAQSHPLLGPDQACELVGLLPAAEYPHQFPYPDALPLDQGWGCSVQGLGVANYGGMEGVDLVGDWCSGRLWGLGWDAASDMWQFQELLHTDLEFTAGANDEDGYVLVVNCNCFYLADEGPFANPPGSLWRVMPVDEVPEGAETARTITRTPPETSPGVGR